MSTNTPFSFGKQAAQHTIEANDLKKRKNSDTNLCNRITDICRSIQCPHNHPHSWQKDCENHCCQRDQRQIVVSCETT